MSRYRLYPVPEQVAGLEENCGHARFVWNLAVEQQSWWTPYRGKAPNHLERCRQLTEARATFDWLRAGSQTVQQQALRDFDQALRNFFGGRMGEVPGIAARARFQVLPGGSGSCGPLACGVRGRPRADRGSRDR
ncbi:hypothetical protein FRACA_2430007 [Frankia canadensis]|uniref:Transposase putative helix-turn-helix domain-containing protein n=1 Tax=Frankia canadensis TaxID=1836972 RepID=A0A2I2KRT8_9ACTN|nr:hypothetical protein FRACA_2430007 [Frankia canadensis]SOU55673.1 hypothetical protein FRACA_2430007 [Frankia canadensis]